MPDRLIEEFMGHKILVVDDDPAIRKMIQTYLEKNSYSVMTADNGSDALLVTKEAHPDLVLSDAEMPGLDGHSLVRVLKKETSTQSIPLMLMSGARIEENNILAGFESGADDYILKPFSLPVLVARIEAVLRRYENASEMGMKLKKCGIELDPEGRKVNVNGKPVPLTRKEFDLLTMLISKSGRVLSVSFLLEKVWGYDPADYNDPGTVEAHISHLRKKLGPQIAKRIVNLTGHGYRFDE